jgi:hypothetical protein
LFYQPKRRGKKIQLLKRVLALTVETYNYLVDYRKSTLIVFTKEEKKYFHNFEKFTPFMVAAEVSFMKYSQIFHCKKLIDIMIAFIIGHLMRN